MIWPLFNVNADQHLRVLLEVFLVHTEFRVHNALREEVFENKMRFFIPVSVCNITHTVAMLPLNRVLSLSCSNDATSLDVK